MGKDEEESKNTEGAAEDEGEEGSKELERTEAAEDGEGKQQSMKSSLQNGWCRYHRSSQ